MSKTIYVEYNIKGEFPAVNLALLSNNIWDNSIF